MAEILFLIPGGAGGDGASGPPGTVIAVKEDGSPWGDPERKAFGIARVEMSVQEAIEAFVDRAVPYSALAAQAREEHRQRVESLARATAHVALIGETLDLLDADPDATGHMKASRLLAEAEEAGASKLPAVSPCDESKFVRLGEWPRKHLVAVAELAKEAAFAATLDPTVTIEAADIPTIDETLLVKAMAPQSGKVGMIATLSGAEELIG